MPRKFIQRRTLQDKRPFAGGRRAAEWTLREQGLVERHYGRIPTPELQGRYLPRRSLVAIKIRARLLGVQARRGPAPPGWTPREDKLLKRHYLALSYREICRRYLPHRSIVGVAIRAGRLGIRNPNRGRAWSEADLKAVRQHFSRPGGLKWLVRKLGRTSVQIGAKADRLGLRRKRDDHWTPTEDALLRRLYPKLGTKTVIGRRPKHGIAKRARKLRIRYAKFGQPWTTRELDLVRRNRTLRTGELMALLPGRTRVAITIVRARRGLAYQPKPRDSYPVYWTKPELRVLRANLDLKPKALLDLLPNRTVRAIGVKRTQIRKGKL